METICEYLPRAADGYLLVEAIVGVVLLGVGALGVATALGQAEQFATLAVQREREAGIRTDLAAGVAFGFEAISGWAPAADAAADGAVSNPTSCWRRVSSAGGCLWIEARCGVGVDDLPAERREPGLLVRR
jgi:Tfp pilus assembly protein PilV